MDGDRGRVERRAQCLRLPHMILHHTPIVNRHPPTTHPSPPILERSLQIGRNSRTRRGMNKTAPPGYGGVEKHEVSIESLSKKLGDLASGSV